MFFIKLHATCSLFQTFANEIGIKDMDDWYSVKSSQLNHKGRWIVDHYYGGSLASAIQTIFPEYQWQTWKFSYLPYKWSDHNNRRSFFDSLTKELNIQKMEDWYKINASQVVKRGGDAILSHFRGSLIKALQSIYPDFPWQFWKFKGFPSSMWTDINNQRQFCNWLETELQIKKMEDWYEVKKSQITEKQGSFLLNRIYDGSLYKALKYIYPQIQWSFWYFHPSSISKDVWFNLDNQKEYFKWLSKELFIRNASDWYCINHRDIKEKKGGAQLLDCYGGSIASLLLAMYPEEKNNWQIWRFENISPSFWNESANRRNFFEWIKQDLSIQTDIDWYKLNPLQVSMKGGSGILQMKEYGGSLIMALRDTFPHFPFSLLIGERLSIQRRMFFDWIHSDLQLENMECWYKVTREDIERRISKEFLLDNYEGNLSKALEEIYPEIEWKLWRFQEELPKNFWNHIKNQMEFFDWVAKELHLKKWTDWYKVKTSDIKRLGGGILMSTHYQDSLVDALKKIYPIHPWQRGKIEIEFESASEEFWKDQANVRSFFEWLNIEFSMNVVNSEDWYQLSTDDVSKKGGATLLQVYGGSVMKALQIAYPEVVWKFHQVSSSFWEDIANIRAFFDWLGKDIGISKMEDWYKVRISQIVDRGAGPLLSAHFEDSLVEALQIAYPTFKWIPWQFERVPKGYWGDVRIQRDFLSYTGKSLGVSRFEDWYGVKVWDVMRIGGDGFLNTYYAGSLTQALQKAYPEVEWKIWRFGNVPAGFWNSDVNVKNYLVWLEEKLSIKNLDDWYHITLNQIIDLRGYGLLRKKGGLMPLLCKYFPDHKWKPLNLFHVATSKSQMYLFTLMQSLFPGMEIKLNFRPKELRSFYTRTNLELDIYIPKLSLAIEYQGIYEFFRILNSDNTFLFYKKKKKGGQHYDWHFLYGSPEMQKKRDSEKRMLCSRVGITLVEIPFWWNRY